MLKTLKTYHCSESSTSIRSDTNLHHRLSPLSSCSKSGPLADHGLVTYANFFIFQDFHSYHSLSLFSAAAAAAKSLQSCPTLCDPIDGSPPGSPVPGIFQARTLEWVAISVSRAWKWKAKVNSLSRVQLLVTPWTKACQAPPSVGFSSQESWSGVSLPSPLINILGVSK